MPTKAKKLVIMAAIAVGALTVQSAGAQSGQGKAGGAAGVGNMTEREKTIRAAADALDIVRWSDIGAGTTRLPGVDVVTTMEFWGSGTASSGGQSYQTDYHAALAYNPPAMRVEMTHAGGDAAHTFQVVREKYAWDESELGGGLVPGKGTATAAMNAGKERLLQLYILPYGVIKAAVAAGDKTKVSTENGAQVLTFPLSGELAGVTVKATLDAKNFVTKVETKADDPALRNLNLEAEFTDYADHGEIPTDVKSPGHIVEKQGGKPMLDLQIKTWDANNPYLVFPVPENVKKAGG
jgi:hypothetical protein